MTNEQLGVLLEFIADGLATEIADLKDELQEVEGLQRQREWWKDGKKKSPVMSLASQKTLLKDGYEARDTGRLLCLDSLAEFLHDLRSRAMNLKS